MSGQNLSHRNQIIIIPYIFSILMQSDPPSIPQCSFTLLSCKMAYKSDNNESQYSNDYYSNYEDAPLQRSQKFPSSIPKNSKYVHPDYQSFCSSRKSLSSYQIQRHNDQLNIRYESDQPINDKLLYYSILKSSIDPNTKGQVFQTKCSTVLQNSELELTERKKPSDCRTSKQNSEYYRSTRKNKKGCVNGRISLKNENKSNFEVTNMTNDRFKEDYHKPKRLKTMEYSSQSSDFFMKNSQRLIHERAFYEGDKKINVQQWHVQKKLERVRNGENLFKKQKNSSGRPSDSLSINSKLQQQPSYTSPLSDRVSIMKISDQMQQQRLLNKGIKQNQTRRVHTEEPQIFQNFQKNEQFHSQKFSNDFQSGQKQGKNNRGILTNNIVSGQFSEGVRSCSKKKGLTVSYCQNQLLQKIQEAKKQSPPLSNDVDGKENQQFGQEIKESAYFLGDIHLQKRETAGFALPLPVSHAPVYAVKKLPGTSSPEIVYYSPMQTERSVTDERFGKKFKTLIALSCKKLDESLGDDKTSSNHISIANNSFNGSSQDSTIFKSRQNFMSKKPKDEGDKIFQTIRMLTSKNLSLHPLQPYVRNNY